MAAGANNAIVNVDRLMHQSAWCIITAWHYAVMQGTIFVVNASRSLNKFLNVYALTFVIEQFSQSYLFPISNLFPEAIFFHKTFSQV